MIRIVVGILFLWLSLGFYGMLANIERVPRVWKTTSPEDWIQHLATLFLGPIGVLMAMEAGGKWKFWSNN